MLHVFANLRNAVTVIKNDSVVHMSIWSSIVDNFICKLAIPNYRCLQIENIYKMATSMAPLKAV